MEETLGVDLENLRSLVSDDIYQFLSSSTESTSSNEHSAPTARPQIVTINDSVDRQ